MAATSRPHSLMVIASSQKGAPRGTRPVRRAPAKKPFGVHSFLDYLPRSFSSGGPVRRNGTAHVFQSLVGSDGHNNNEINLVFRGMVRQKRGLLTKEICGKYWS